MEMMVALSSFRCLPIGLGSVRRDRGPAVDVRARTVAMRRSLARSHFPGKQRLGVDREWRTWPARVIGMCSYPPVELMSGFDKLRLTRRPPFTPSSHLFFFPSPCYTVPASDDMDW